MLEEKCLYPGCEKHAGNRYTRGLCFTHCKDPAIREKYGLAKKHGGGARKKTTKRKAVARRSARSMPRSAQKPVRKLAGSMANLLDEIEKLVDARATEIAREKLDELMKNLG